jgi:hypothetical protein
MSTTSQRSRTAITRAAALILPLIATAAILLRFPPSRYNYYPRCPIYTLFHIQCPGCGATRALAALLHGHISEALHLNALFTIAFPFLLLCAAINLRHYLTGKPIRWPNPSKPAIYAALVIAAVFTIARNL